MTHSTAVRGGSRGGFGARQFVLLLLMGCVALLAACGSSSTSQTVIAVQTPQLKTIAVDPPAPTLALGLTTQFTATGIYTDGSQRDLSQSVTWTSSNAAVASVSNSGNANGLTTAVSQGTASIKATLGLISGEAALTVTGATLEFIAVTPNKSSVGKGLTLQFAATGIYSDHSTRDLSTTVTWSSGNTSIASISNANATYGLATGTGLGSATITASLANLSGSTTLTVTASTLASIAVSPVNASAAKGATQAFVATGTYSDGTTQTLTTQVTWTSAAPAVATINAAGIATAINVGATVITAALGSVSGSTNLTVGAAALVSIAVTPQSATIAARTTQQFTATGTYSDGTTQNLTATAAWTSGTPAVASINYGGSTGLAKALSIGSSAITAAQGGITSPPATLNVTAANQYAYATDFVANGTVLAYGVNSTTGGLTPLAPATVPVGNGPFSLVVDPTDTYLYVADYFDQIILPFQIEGNGSLTAIGTPVATGATPNGVVVDPNGRYLYAANFGDGTLSQYSITNGVLAALPTPTVAAGNGPASIAIDPSGSFAYAANFTDGTISGYTIGAAGSLTPTATQTSGVGTNVVVIGPGAQFAYAVNSGHQGMSDGTITLYSITNGVLSAPVTAATGLNYPRNLVFVTPVAGSPTYAYLTDKFANTVVEYQLVPTTGQLTPLGTVAAGSAEDIAIDQTNQYVYVTDRAQSTISQFSINAQTGLLTPLGAPTVAAGTAPTGIVTAY